VLQCVAVCCSILHFAPTCSMRVAVECSVLHCVAVYCSVHRQVALYGMSYWLDRLKCAVVCCSVLQYVAACCSVMQCVAGSVLHPLLNYFLALYTTANLALPWLIYILCVCVYLCLYVRVYICVYVRVYMYLCVCM